MNSAISKNAGKSNLVGRILGSSNSPWFSRTRFKVHRGVERVNVVNTGRNRGNVSETGGRALPRHAVTRRLHVISIDQMKENIPRLFGRFVSRRYPPGIFFREAFTRTRTCSTSQSGFPCRLAKSYLRRDDLRLIQKPFHICKIGHRTGDRIKTRVGRHRKDPFTLKQMPLNRKLN